MTRATNVMIASFNAAVAAMSMLALRAFSAAGQVVVYIILFAFVSIAGLSFVSDVLSRSNQTITALRSIGATKKIVTKSVITGPLLSAIGGSVLGAAIGAGLGAGLGPMGLVTIQGPGLGAADVVVNGALILVSSLAAMGLGVYSGVSRSWRS
jgi:ABC-type lipoprotein release transport system permease subunit